MSSPQNGASNPAESYDAILVPAMFDPWAEELVSRTGVSEGDHVLDVACGTGAVAFRVASQVGKAGSVTGSDISPGMIAVARRKASERSANISFVEGDAEHLPIREGGYDVLLCQQGLQFFPDKVTALASFRRAMKRGGRLGVAVWQSQEHQDILPDFEAAMQRHLGERASLSQPFSFGDANELESVLTAAEFVDVTIHAVSRQVRFPSASGYVSMMFRPAAAVMPEFAQISPQEIEEIAAKINVDLQSVLQRYTVGDALEMTMRANIAVARA